MKKELTKITYVISDSNFYQKMGFRKALNQFGKDISFGLGLNYGNKRYSL
ncbi:MAG: hypothetical protein LKF69_03460 [Bacilli bacterium]|jgi:hypothetical protein|nr:hypothetical protein [Bacilli bacterium]MCH4235838.1 hypothetical protein [Bacilli bacterium]